MMLVDAPAKQNASAIHTSTSSRSNSGGGFNRLSHWPYFISSDVKTPGGCSVPYGGDFGRFFPFWFLKTGMRKVKKFHSSKNRYDSTAF
jgi:hypothetical protein